MKKLIRLCMNSLKVNKMGEEIIKFEYILPEKNSYCGF